MGLWIFFFFFQAEDGIRDRTVTGVQTCALPICNESSRPGHIAPVGSPANALTIMAVAALDKALAPAPFSCGGVNPGQDVDIAAPGVDVLSSLPGNRYGRLSGTSMATPHASGVAALIAQSDVKFRGRALWERLLELAGPLPHPARDVGKGLLLA